LIEIKSQKSKIIYRYTKTSTYQLLNRDLKSYIMVVDAVSQLNNYVILLITRMTSFIDNKFLLNN